MIVQVLLESAVLCLFLLIGCTVGIANGAAGLVCLYEKEVQERAVKLGLTTQARIKHNANLFRLCVLLPGIAFSVAAVYGFNGARGFFAGFWQLAAIWLCEGLFDRLFIDWFWVGKTKAWVIPGTEDLMPYIYGKTLAGKWLMTLVGYPLFSAAIAGIMAVVIR